jgi:hypothetical protein
MRKSDLRSPSGSAAPRRGIVERAARVAFTFVVMNISAVAGLGVALFGGKVWRES